MSTGYNEQTMKNARRKVADTDRSGFGKDQVHTWILRTGTPTGTAGTTNEKPVPAVPQEVSVAVPATEDDQNVPLFDALALTGPAGDPFTDTGTSSCWACGQPPDDKAGLGSGGRCSTCELQGAPA